VFSHWSLLSGEAHDVTTKLGALVNTIRVRKGLKAEYPDIANYIDRL